MGEKLIEPAVKVDDCLFCKIVAGDIPATKLYEDDRVLAFMDINPVNDGHLLVIPRNHADSILDIDPEDLQMIAVTVQGLAQIVRRVLKPDGLNIIQSNGKAAGQVVGHYHMHLIPRAWDDRMSKMTNWEMIPGDMDQISEVAEKIKIHIG